MNLKINACLAVVALAATTAVAQVPVADRALVFVADITGGPGLETDASSLTSSLCSSIAKDKRLDVLCAPDVRQIMGFAAVSSATGAASPAMEKLQSRLESVDFVINGTLNARGKDTLALVVIAGPRAAGADPTSPYAEKILIKLEEVGSGKSTQLLERLPEMASRIGKTLIAPATTSTATP